jgi:hypothetical protein
MEQIEITAEYLAYIRENLKQGDQKRIADMVNTNQYYVSMILRGVRPCNSKTAKRVIDCARDLILKHHEQIIRAEQRKMERTYFYGKQRQVFPDFSYDEYFNLRGKRMAI